MRPELHQAPSPLTGRNATLHAPDSSADGRGEPRPGTPGWAYLAAVAVGAAFVYVAATVGVQIGETGGIARTAVACLLSFLAGAAVYSATAARGAADRSR